MTRSIWTIALACVLAAAAPPRADAQPSPPPLPTLRPDAPGAARAAGAMATVNGKPVGMKDLNDILLSAYGLPVAQQLIALELARQGAAKEGVALPTEAEVDAEHERTLTQMFRRLGSPDQYEQHLDRFLVQRNMSRGLWRIVVRRNAILRKIVLKLAKKEIETITDEQVREQYYRVYDRKVVVRHVQTKSLEIAQKVKQLADKGVNFELLVGQYSQAASRKDGGLLPPIGRGTTQISPALREAALAMRKIGEISSPVQAGAEFHVLQLARIIEPQKVTFAQVKDKLIAEMKENRISHLRNRYMQALLQQAKVEYVNPILKAQEAKARADRAKAGAGTGR